MDDFLLWKHNLAFEHFSIASLYISDSIGIQNDDIRSYSLAKGLLEGGLEAYDYLIRFLVDFD
jgi:hypothetical protein